MTTYNTGNPIGSKDPRDLYDNAENLDTAVNDTSSDTWSDRLGRSRKTLSGMERQFDADQDDRDARFNTFIASSGYQFLGDYEAGIEITEYNQIVRDSGGEFWRLSGQVELPYTTTGAGLPEDDSFVSVGDAALRQELGNPSHGAALIARGVLAVESIADLLALPQGQRRGDLRYMVCDSVFLWDGTEFAPQGYVDVGAWLPDYAEPAEAIEAAINSGWPLDFKSLKINVGRPINPDTIEQEIDWVADGCVITLTTGPHEYVLRLRVPVGNHSINGRLCFDANQNAYSGLQVWSTQGNCVFESEKLEARNIYRSAKLWVRGDGLFFRGGFSRLHLKSPKVVGVILAPGAGTSGTIGVHGITATNDITTGLYPLYTVLDDPYVEDVYSEDIEYTMDQDGCRLFGRGSSASPEEENSVAIVNGGEFINCAGRSIKGQVSSLTVDGTTFRRDGPFLRDRGNPEIDSQHGPLIASNVKAFYKGKVPQPLFRVGSRIMGDSGSSITGVSVVVLDTVLPTILDTYARSDTARHVTMSNVSVSGAINRFAISDTNNDKLFVHFNGLFATSVVEEGFRVQAAPGGTSPFSAEVTIEGVTQLGPAVPLLRHRITGNLADAYLSATRVVGFEESPYAANIIPELGPSFKVEGIRGTEPNGAILRMPSLYIRAGEVGVFPAQSYSVSNSSSIVLLQTNTSSNSYNALFSATRDRTDGMFVGSGVTLGGSSDPGGSGLSVWVNSDSSLNVKNNTSGTLRVSLCRFG